MTITSEPERTIATDTELNGETSGALSVADGATLTVAGIHRGSVSVQGGGNLVVGGELHGALTLESLASATVLGDVVGPVEVRVAGTLVIEESGRIAGPLTSFGSTTNRGLRSGRAEGRVPDDQPGSTVAEPGASGVFPPLPPR